MMNPSSGGITGLQTSRCCLAFLRNFRIVANAFVQVRPDQHSMLALLRSAATLSPIVDDCEREASNRASKKKAKREAIG
jgi:hypothetical protein